MQLQDLAEATLVILAFLEGIPGTPMQAMYIVQLSNQLEIFPVANLKLGRCSRK